MTPIVKQVRRIAGLVGVACVGLLAACQTGPAPEADATHETYATTSRVANAMGHCWFNAGNTLFPDHIYSPEPNNSPPRILIVPKAQPAERPILVVEVRGANSITLYGPQLDTPNGPRLRADVERWAQGGEACS